MNGEVMTHIVPIRTRTFAAPEGVRLELDDDTRGTYGVIMISNDSLLIGLDLIKTYFIHCFLWIREKINPFSSK